MEIVHAERVSPPRLLVSLHDISPLTIGHCRDALALFAEVGLPLSCLSGFVIPLHEGRIAVDRDPATMDLLGQLADGGATLVMHGLTHRMAGRCWTPAAWFRGHLFARGQGELLRSDAADTARRLDEGRAIFRRAGLEAALRGFVPPAWLLSPAARQVVHDAGFDFYETFGGIVARGRAGGDRLLARRVIGWGSLNAIEARATALYAAFQCRLPAADTRVAVHPADMARPGQRRAVGRALGRLLARMPASSYADYLALA
jgi:predicted deacetylase